MTNYGNGTYSFEYQGMFRRYELGIKPNETVVHNKSTKLQKWGIDVKKWFESLPK